MRFQDPRFARLTRCAALAALTPILLAVSLPAYSQEAAADSQSAEQISQLRKQVDELRQLVLSLQSSVAELRAAASLTPNAPAGARAPPAQGGAAPAANAAPSVAAAPAPVPAAAGTAVPGAAPATAKTGADFLRGLTINALLDTYYEYNFDDPVGRVNLLRAYDVSSNNFSLNQADLLIESAPDLSIDKRFGMRVDLQYGQASETLQGNPANELRPEIYRNVFQAYGSYWIPIHGNLLTLDFGKWASSLGIEGNYSKDQWNYSRSFWFDYLPFYHSGLRASYKANDLLTFNYWVTNGTQQTEAFNNFKDELIGFVLQPTASLSWTFNYYLGQEHPDVMYITNPGPGQQNLPTQQGTAFIPIPNAPNGRLKISDTYLTWQATPALSLGAEADYVTDQLYSYSPYQRATGGALYARYQLTPSFWLATRGEYLGDPAGLFSGQPQYLKEATLTGEYKVADGFLVFVEWRRDASNRPYFLTPALYVYDSHQDTLGFGLVWWLGQKEGSW